MAFLADSRDLPPFKTGEAIHRLVSEQGPLKAEEISKALDMHRTTIKGYLERGCRKGIYEAEKGKYRLKRSPP